MPAEQRLKSYRVQIEQRLEELLPTGSIDGQPELHDAMRYAVLGSGKRLRPVLCMASAEAVGGRAEAAVDVACAIELIHCFSLVHDDLPALDDDDLRRGRATLHKVYGEAIAILAGDALFALAFAVVARAGIAPARKAAVISEIARAVGSEGLVGGETLDILSEDREVGERRLHEIHTRKTGALIEAACVSGGICGRGFDRQLDDLRTYGRVVGLAFQIADDVLNETASPAQIGKSSGSDRARGKATYPSVYGVDRSMATARDCVGEARQALARLPGPTELLDELANFAIERAN